MDKDQITDRPVFFQPLAKERVYFYVFFTPWQGFLYPLFTAFRYKILHVAGWKNGREREEGHMVNDAGMIGLVVLLFVVFWGFIKFCERA
ncbi:hypothetical protein [Paenibacillus illinoisensis]|uniref:hypothetical protein n=1 Tax=Paenibacillus illinoisensis TaxID=59845 RepID=UPI000DA118AF|nr:hypothetical protein [Paenibacillus illinoisensis]